MKVTLLKLEQVGRRDGNVSAPFVFVLCYEQAAYLIDEGWGDSGHDGGVAGYKEGPAPGACLVLDGWPSGFFW